MSLTSLFCAAILAAAANEGPAGEERARVMIVGVYHFDAPNLDYLKSEKVDHLSEAKQAEIAEVLDRLAAFAPTKIVLEAPPDAAEVQRRYARFVAGEYELAADEREQLGFQLAKQFSHETVYLADHPADMDLGSVLAAAQEAGDQRFLAWFQAAMKEGQALLDAQSRMSVRDALVMLNEPAHQAKDTRDLYLQLARVRDPRSFVGADVLADWYRRNFRIFTNLAGVIDSPSDRVLVLFGQGHVPYLRELVQSSPDLELVEPNDYLRR